MLYMQEDEKQMLKGKELPILSSVFDLAFLSLAQYYEAIHYFESRHDKIYLEQKLDDDCQFALM